MWSLLVPMNQKDNNIKSLLTHLKMKQYKLSHKLRAVCLSRLDEEMGNDKGTREYKHKKSIHKQKGRREKKKMEVEGGGGRKRKEEKQMW